MKLKLKPFAALLPLKTALLIVMMLVNCNSFCQNKVKQQINLNENDSLVCIPKYAAKNVAKKIVLLGAVLKEDSLLKSNIEILKQQVANRDSVVVIKDTSIAISNRQLISSKKEVSIYQAQHISDENKLHSTKFKNTLLEAVIIAALAKIFFFK